MAKAVLISIRPEWVEKILAGEKTLEVRKNRPNMETPFKIYIYCTAGNLSYEVNDGMMCNLSGGRLVVGEFVCDKIDVIQRRGIPANFDYCYLSLNEWGNDDIETEIRDIMGSCIPKERLNSYAGKTPVLYAWHISDLKVYDTPKPLSAFKGLCKIEVGCWECPYYNYTKMDCDGRTIKRPPQSWCYVEELQ